MTARILAAVLGLVAVGGCVPTNVAPLSRPPDDPAARGPAFTSPSAGAPARAVADTTDERVIRHVLSRVTFGARPGDVERGRAGGLGVWLERQLQLATIEDSATDAVLRELPTLGMTIPALLQAYPRPDPAVRGKIGSGEMSRAEMLALYPPAKRPGSIAAELAAAAREQLFEQRDLAVTTDFRALFGEVVRSHLGVPPTAPAIRRCRA